MPNTPLKETERRADKWRSAWNLEQTEIDALATLRPDVLERIVRDAVEPFYDAELKDKVEEAQEEWLELAKEAVEEQLGDERRNALAELEGQVKAVNDKLADLGDQVDDLCMELGSIEKEAKKVLEGFHPDLPEMEIPEAEVDEDAQGLPICSTKWSWVEQTEALNRRKQYIEGEEE